MTRVIVVGAGGHGSVVVDILQAMQAAGVGIEATAVVDDERSLHGTTVLGVPVAGGVASLARVAHDAIVVAIGDNQRREALSVMLQERGERLAVAQHPSAVIGRGTVIEPGAVIGAGVVIGPECRIHAGAIVNTSSSVDHHNIVGPYAHVAPGAHCGGAVTIGLGALVGIGATILPGRTIGRAAIVGAGAVVTRDVPERAVTTGAPARVIRTLR